MWDSLPCTKVGKRHKILSFWILESGIPSSFPWKHLVGRFFLLVFKFERICLVSNQLHRVMKNMYNPCDSESRNRIWSDFVRQQCGGMWQHSSQQSLSMHFSCWYCSNLNLWYVMRWQSMHNVSRFHLWGCTCDTTTNVITTEDSWSYLLQRVQRVQGECADLDVEISCERMSWGERGTRTSFYDLDFGNQLQNSLVLFFSTEIQTLSYSIPWKYHPQWVKLDMKSSSIFANLKIFMHKIPTLALFFNSHEKVFYCDLLIHTLFLYTIYTRL